MKNLDHARGPGFVGIRRLIAIIAIFAMFTDPVYAATFTVDDASDTADPTPGDGSCVAISGRCTFRSAIDEANALAGTDTIVGQAGTTTTNPASAITISTNVIIDSTSTNRIVLDAAGTDAASYNALEVDRNADGSQIRGLYIIDYANGVGINIADGADSITIGGTTAQGNIIGLNTASAVDANSTGITSAGTNVTISGNYISGNTTRGIYLINGAKDTTIKNNTIGVKSDGTAAGNGSNAIEVSGTAVSMDGGNGGVEGLVIGGPQATEGNVIASSTAGNGVLIGAGTGSVAGTVKIQGNFIGLNSSNVARGNSLAGISIGSDFSPTSDITIGTDGDGSNDSTEGNRIGSNGTQGISVIEGDDVVIAGNTIGTTPSGDVRGNTSTGIVVGSVSVGPNTLRIGSDNGDSNERNTVANNGAGGITINNATTINVAGNYVGIAPDGSTSAANSGGAPLSIAASQATVINIGMAGVGGIYGNFLDNGPAVNGALVISNTASGATVKIKNASIGMDAFGVSRPNSTNGMYLTAPANYTIGTDLDGTSDDAEYNTIGNNTDNGIYIGNGALTATITGNRIGCVGVPCTDAAGNGTTGAAGSKNGIKIASNSLTALTIGGSNVNQRNVITGSGEHAISITDAGSAIAWTIRNNYLGWGSDGTTVLGNTGSGISAADGGALTIVDNVIGNNSSNAVNLTGGTSLTFTGNLIGTNSSGIVVGANNGHGLVLNNSTMTSAVIGGSTAGLSNIFASATGVKDGIYIQQLASSAATVSIKGNYIGVCATTSTGAITTANVSTCKNSGRGIEALYGALTIGGDNSLGDAGTGTIAEGNVISGNAFNGIDLIGSNVSSATIYGNIIGLIREAGSATGVFNVADGNSLVGVSAISSGITTLTVGGVGSTTASSKRNIIASSGTVGLWVETMAATGVATIKNNFLGTDWLGTTDRGNAGDGVYIAPTVAGMTINVGGTSTNEGNVVSGNTGDGIDVNGVNAVTVNLYQNLVGLAYGGAAKLANDVIGLNLRNNNSTVTVGNAETTGRNVISGNASYGIKATGGNITIRGNYIGTDGSGTGSSTFANGTNEIYAENTSSSISALRIGGSLNRINDLTHVGVYLKDITTWNETNSYLETDNEWSSRVNATAPTYNYWQRYVSGVLTAYGPQVCYDYLDNDNDGTADLGDTGCSNVRDTDEYNDTGGGIVIGLGSTGSSSTGTTTTTTTTTTPATTTTTDTGVGEINVDSGDDSNTADRETVVEDNSANSNSETTEQPAQSPVFDSSLIENKNIRRYVVSEKLAEAVSPVTDAITGRDHVNLGILLGSVTDVPRVAKAEVVLTMDQKTIANAVEQVARGEDLSMQQAERVERTVEAVVNQSVQQILEAREADISAGLAEGTGSITGGGGGAIVAALSVRAANGKLVNINKDTNLKFTLNGKKAVDLQEIADARGENKVYLTSYTPIGDSDVSAMLAISEGAKRLDDPDAGAKIFFGGLKGLAADSLTDVKAQIKGPTFTNLPDGIELASKSVLYIVGPNPNEKVTVFVIDKVDSTDPNNWKIYEVGTYTLDDTGKAAVEVDFTDKMAGDFKNFELLVQNEKDEGFVQEVVVNKGVQAKMDSVMLRDGNGVVPADLTNDGGFVKNLKTSVLWVAEIAKQEKTQEERMVLTGYAEPGSVVFVTWESVLLSSAVIADASQGYFEVDVPKQLAKGDHKVLTYSYNKPKRTASAYSRVLFKKIF